MFTVRRSEPSSIFRSTFRDQHSEATFRAILITFSVSAFRAFVTPQFDVQSRILGFGFQSHHYRFSVSAFRAIITPQFDLQSRIPGFGVKSHHCIFRSAFRAITAFSFGVPSHHFSVWRSESSSFSVLAFRAIIAFQF